MKRIRWTALLLSMVIGIGSFAPLNVSAEEDKPEETAESAEILSEETAEETPETVIQETEEEPEEQPEETAEEGYEDIPSTEASIRGFVVRLYRVVLQREPDDTGYKTWTEGITNGTITGCSAVKGFFLSKEINARNLSNETFVTLLYQAVLNRGADAAGMKTWTDCLSVLMTREYVINGFLNSKEFAGLCETYGVTKGTAARTSAYRDRNYQITAFVYRLYVKVLGRTADAGGIEGWTRKVYTEGATGADLAAGFVLSPEYKNKNTSNEDYVRMLYQAVLNREGSAKEISSWAGRLAEGKTRKEILAGFVNSAEFGNLCKQYGIERGKLVLEGWKTVNGKRYYYKADGKMAAKEILTIGGKQYAFDEDGVWIGDKSTAYLNVFRKAIALVNEVTNSSMSKTQKLRACFDVFKKFKEKNPWIPHDRSDGWELRYASNCFDTRSGNCFSYAVTFAFMAKVLGYENVYCCNSTGHGWAEINGLVYDPEWTLHREGNYFGRPLGTGSAGDPNYLGAINRNVVSNAYVKL
ncbi:MAG: DUF4214 domain-containing protein [Solobacterium sp.]|nr:DUF4214 domain-containing protein [Solobacterium sp.]